MWIHTDNTTALTWCLMLGITVFSSFTAVANDDNAEAWLLKARQHLNQSQYWLTLDDLDNIPKTGLTVEQQAQVQGLMGLTYIHMHRQAAAEEALRQALAVDTTPAGDRARWLMAWANLDYDQGHDAQAQQHYQQASALAGNQLELALGIRLGLAELAPQSQKLSTLQAIREELPQISDPVLRARYWFTIGTQANALGAAGIELAYHSFEQSRQLAPAQSRLWIESLDGLAQVYESQQRSGEALRLDQAAIPVAQQLEAHDLLINLYWRQGRLYRRQQQFPEAGAAYQQAVDHIEAIRHDIPLEYHHGRSSFRELLEPVYLGLADNLLLQAREQPDEAQTVLLKRARDAVELIKQSELEDFLGGRCALQGRQQVALDDIATSTAVVYPILLPDRLELLVSSGGEIAHFSQAVPAASVQAKAQELAFNLRNNYAKFKSLSTQLYQWLFAPIEPWLQAHHTQIVVMVPDGALRLVPPAALYDGTHYLVEKYAISTSPGLNLFDPSPLQRQGIQALLAGMSEPGEVVQHLPAPFLKAMTGGGRGLNLATTPSHSRALPFDANATERQADTQHLLQQPGFEDVLKARLSLPGVGEEIHTLQEKVPNTTLLNETFTVAQFKQQITQSPYTVVHIASHGVFGHSSESSFLMTYDNIINIDDLERLLKSDKFAKQPIELLTLSACQTAEGDDRAPLGISGMALRAKVRSALGSLWPVDDFAASSLMQEFYQALSQPNTNKVQALRQAQLKLLQQPESAHPYYWSPFILVGNWL